MKDEVFDEDLRLAWQIRQILDQGTETLDRRVCLRLYAARQAALARVAETPLQAAGIGGQVIELLPQALRTIMIAAALIAGVVGSWYWNNFQQAEKNEAIDSALLADELPLDAYLDHGFHAWLERQSASSSALPLE